jgi:hypothetical protein
MARGLGGSSGQWTTPSNGGLGDLGGGYGGSGGQLDVKTVACRHYDGSGQRPIAACGGLGVHGGGGGSSGQLGLVAEACGHCACSLGDLSSGSGVKARP